MKCKHCNKEFSIEKRIHLCTDVRRQNSKPVDAITIYNPSLPKANKQSTIPGYMKKFGSRKAG